MSKMSELSYDLQQAAMIIADHNYDLRAENEKLRQEIKELKATLQRMTLKAARQARRDMIGDCGND
jgi:cell division septum initiation protein DivIVA